MTEDLAVYRIDTTDNNRIVIELGDRPQRITGGAKIVQEVTRLLLTTPGTIENRPTQGAGLNSLLLRTGSQGNVDATRADIVSRISDVSQQVKQNQSGIDLEPDETLDRLEILSVQFTSRWEIRVRIRTLTASLIVDFGNVLIPEGTELFGE